MSLLQVKNITKQLPNGLLIKDINFEYETLQKIAITGESGAGKTTLLKIISAQVQPDKGSIFFNGERVIGPDEKLLPGHREIAYLSQDHELLHNYKVDELVWFENKLSFEEASDLFKVCQIDHLLKRKTDQLSGGEQQRIVLCLLLMKAPRLLVLDEPFSNLDLLHKNILRKVLADITERLQITCMLTSHDPYDTLSWADEIIVMKEGSIVQKGTPEEIYHQPVNEYIAGLFGKYNLLNPSTAALFGIESNGNSVMTRPEHFVMSTTGNGINGIIQKISFWGNFYEADVMVKDARIIIRMMKNNWEPGKKVLVNIRN